jgi:hypothetical protein
VFSGLWDCDRPIESSPRKVLDFPFYNSKGKASHTIEGMEREEKNPKERRGARSYDVPLLLAAPGGL